MKKIYCKVCKTVIAYLNFDEKIVGPQYCSACLEAKGIDIPSRIVKKEEK